MGYIQPVNHDGGSMRKTPLLLSLLLLLVSSLGCATITAKKVGPADDKVEGIRYWLAAPYLLVQAPVEVSRTETLYRLDLLNEVNGKLKLVPMDDQGSAGAPGHAAVFIDRNEPLGRAVLAAYTTAASAQGNLPGNPPPADNKPKTAGAGSGSGTQSKAGTGDGGGVKPDTSMPAPAAPSQDAPPATPPANAVSVTWLPDYCEQYALQQTNVLSTSKLKVDLGDGWKLTGFDSTLDSTQLLGKVLDLVGSVVGAGKGGGGTGGGTSGAGASGAGNQPQADKILVYLRKVTITSLRPGIYPLTNRPNDDCSKRARFQLPTNLTEVSTTWAVAPASVKWP